MADPNPNLKVIAPEIEKQSRFENFICNHPRTSALVGSTAFLILNMSVIYALKSKKSETVNSSSDTDLQELVQLESTETAQV